MFLIYFISYFIYSLIVFNDVTMHRYKIPILFFVIFGYFVNVKKENLMMVFHLISSIDKGGAETHLFSSLISKYSKKESGCNLLER